MKVTFVIENLERVSEWVLLEYMHAMRIAGKDNLIICGKYGKGCPEFTKGHSWQMRLPDPIVLDPAASEMLEPEDFSVGDNFVVVGGICGDFPPKARTSDLLSKNFPGARLRSLGGLQLSIDNAIWVAKRISEGKRLSELPFVQQVEIPTGKFESVKLNFGYPLVEGKPNITPGLERLLRKRKDF
jgi:ribosome biogenesis SPOUT family RNA methylase Rps3